MLELLQSIDRALFVFLNGLGSPSWDAFWLLLSEKAIGAPLVLFFLWKMYHKYGLVVCLKAILALAILILVTDQLANTFKYGFARPRPCHEPLLDVGLRLVKDRCGGPYGFFSAHAANSMAVAIFMGMLLRQFWSWFIYVGAFLAFMVGFSRIYLGVHYPFDVLIGFFIGAFFAYLAQFIFKKQVLFKQAN
ncbi:phosphatase PAP2 family protein [Flavobacteriaceae bacterium]|nr:phosphatase PAP2 family protein [Flavobacteriaceae bacterium]